MKIMVNVRLDDFDHRAMKIYCVQRGITIQSFLTEAIRSKVGPEIQALADDKALGR